MGEDAGTGLGFSTWSPCEDHHEDHLPFVPRQRRPVQLLGIIGAQSRMQRRQWRPTPVLLPGKSHRRRSLVGCSPWGC